ncbi:D-alanine--D-alanine ligase domain protein [Alkalidesulfovibrio alkalitolerans DSM 16529]|uniref:D-alanine--D-alanine ligase domain protein n=1 Tax=Alkalidesulfovibrio alkalitolerans DSM 16529 TaxID=1121439 RepID=S7TFY0_9BACT|nr:hypothetical protein [Alkalidesulfovibrio alkalitolerans]EPR36127.1 D-alanine--D-alanine ligase domain protein [Alkalidesulfovibrio alkalitolerans DSM 16529]
MRVALLTSRLAPDSPADDLDSLVQAEAVGEALRSLGHATVNVSADLDLSRLLAEIKAARVDAVFNLAETLMGTDALAHVVPDVLARAGVACTGSGGTALVLSNDKPLAKRLLAARGIPTPAWAEVWSETGAASRTNATDLLTTPFSQAAQKGPDARRTKSSRPTRSPATRGLELFTATQQMGLFQQPARFAPGPYIIKPCREHASKGIGQDSVVEAASPADLAEALAKAHARQGLDLFAEAYVEGREFAVSLLADEDGLPRALPPAEMRFSGQWRRTILTYDAKWNPECPEYGLSTRAFDLSPEDAGLTSTLSALALACWRAFGLSGYARVDFRVDKNGAPWVIDINANPCLAPDAGFAAACEQAGIPYGRAVERILSAAVRTRNTHA